MKTIFLLTALFCGFLPSMGASLADTNSPAPAEKTKVCFLCKGSGKMKCPVPSCRNGESDCPGQCLRLSRGTWIHMDVPGHPATDLWQKFYSADQKQYQAWTTAHLGEVIQMQNGQPVNVGQCPICKGTTRVKCSVCKGTGEVACAICDGKKLVPESWTAFDNPKQKNRPSHFKLKDGTEIVGRRVMSVGDQTKIRTEKGEVEIDTAKIVSEEKPPLQK